MLTTAGATLRTIGAKDSCISAVPAGGRLADVSAAAGAIRSARLSAPPSPSTRRRKPIRLLLDIVVIILAHTRRAADTQRAAARLPLRVSRRQAFVTPRRS